MLAPLLALAAVCICLACFSLGFTLRGFLERRSRSHAVVQQVEEASASISSIVATLHEQLQLPRAS